MKKLLYKYYIYDEISDFWQKNRQITDLDRLINDDSELFRYEK